MIDDEVVSLSYSYTVAILVKDNWKTTWFASTYTLLHRDSSICSLFIHQFNYCRRMSGLKGAYESNTIKCQMRIVNTMRIGKNWEKGHGWSSLYIHRWQIHILLCKSPAPVTSKITFFCEIGGKIYYQLTLQPHVFFSTKVKKNMFVQKLSGSVSKNMLCL